MEALFEELKGRYSDRLIVYDLPPLLSSDDALVSLPYIDSSLLVVHEGKTRKREIKRSLDILRNFNFLGTVLNNSDEKYLDLYY
jgi:Mrp family chromosome partitioning ATPase